MTPYLSNICWCLLIISTISLNLAACLINSTEQIVIAESCIKLIKNNDFEQAGDLFSRITDIDKISYIVNKTYSSQNFYKILNVSDYITNTSYNFYLLDALNKEISVNSPMNVTELVSLAYTLSENIINRGFLEREISFKAEHSMYRLGKDIVALMVSYFDDCSKGDDLYQDCNAKLLSKIYSFDCKLVVDIVKQLYSNPKYIAVERIIQLFLIDNLSNAKTLFDLLKLIHGVYKKIGKVDDYNTDIIDFLKEKPIPEIIRTILFAKKVGLSSKGTEGKCSYQCILKNIRPPRGNYNLAYDHLVLEKAFVCPLNTYASTYCFKIRPSIYEDYYLAVDVYDKIVLEKESHDWTINVVDESYMKIRNEINRKYIMAFHPYFGSYTGVYTIEDEDNYLWRIIDCSKVHNVRL